MNVHAPCPCGKSTSYAQCCGIYHRGERECTDAETLMRSRYAAFATKNIEYLLHSLHRDHTDWNLGESSLRARLRVSVDTLRYMGLRILDVAAPDSDGIARVLFHAKIFNKGRDVGIVEASDFAHDGIGWRYLHGVTASSAMLHNETDEVTLARFLERRTSE
jgi:SEC-C motif domain protein